MYSSSPLEFHIICDQTAQEYLEKRLSLLTHPQHPILVRFYRIPRESMVARIDREGAINTDHAAGVRKSSLTSLARSMLTSRAQPG